MNDETCSRNVNAKIRLERFDDCSGNVRLFSPTIFRRLTNAYPEYELRMKPGDTYGIDARGTALSIPQQILGIDVVGYPKN